ncbi:MAG TPA: energy transducer TonB [Sphingomicrobium sp.]|nr:energy transducer TonB [Sphingomicrobium sp.]
MVLVRCAIVAACAALAAATGASAATGERKAPAPPIGADSEGMFFVSYPKVSLQRGEQGVVHYRLDVAPDGRPMSCSVTKSSGHRRLDNLTCAAAVHLARFTPATNAKDFPIPGVYDGKVSWTIQ